MHRRELNGEDFGLLLRQHLLNVKLERQLHASGATAHDCPTNSTTSSCTLLGCAAASHTQGPSQTAAVAPLAAGLIDTKTSVTTAVECLLGEKRSLNGEPRRDAAAAATSVCVVACRQADHHIGLSQVAPLALAVSPAPLAARPHSSAAAHLTTTPPNTPAQQSTVSCDELSSLRRTLSSPPWLSTLSSPLPRRTASSCSAAALSSDAGTALLATPVATRALPAHEAEPARKRARFVDDATALDDSPFAKLPAELLAHVLEKLPHADRMRASLSCRRFANVLRESRSHLLFRRAQVMSPHALRDVLRSHHRASRVRVRTTDGGLAALVAEAPDLRELDLSRSDSLTAAGLTQLRNLRALECLSLCDCPAVTDSSVAHLAGLSSLRRLSLSYCTLTDAGVEELCARLPQLTHLSLWGCYRITDEALRHIGTLRHLAQLDLWGCFQLRSGLVHLRSLQRLRSLNLQGCRMLQSDGARALASLQLTELNLSGCVALCNASLSVALSTQHCLRSLAVRSVPWLTADALPTLCSLAALQHLDLSHCPALQAERDDFDHLLKLPTLKHLNLQNCHLSVARCLAEHPDLPSGRLEILSSEPIDDATQMDVEVDEHVDADPAEVDEDENEDEEHQPGEEDDDEEEHEEEEEEEQEEDVDVHDTATEQDEDHSGVMATPLIAEDDSHPDDPLTGVSYQPPTSAALDSVQTAAHDQTVLMDSRLHSLVLA